LNGSAYVHVWVRDRAPKPHHQPLANFFSLYRPAPPPFEMERKYAGKWAELCRQK